MIPLLFARRNRPFARWWGREKKERPAEEQAMENSKSGGFRKWWQELLTKAAANLINSLIIFLVTSFVVGVVWQRLVVNPSVNFRLSGYVHEYDHPERPILGAEIFILDRPISFKTGEDGRFEGEVKVRRKDLYIVLTCARHPFQTEQKRVDIPREKRPIHFTVFALRPY
jgi:hypothetical protein